MVAILHHIVYTCSTNYLFLCIRKEITTQKKTGWTPAHLSPPKPYSLLPNPNPRPYAQSTHTHSPSPPPHAHASAAGAPGSTLGRRPPLRPYPPRCCRRARSSPPPLRAPPAFPRPMSPSVPPLPISLILVSPLSCLCAAATYDEAERGGGAGQRRLCPSPSSPSPREFTPSPSPSVLPFFHLRAWRRKASSIAAVQPPTRLAVEAT